jgi:hypothetical protein
MIPFSRIKDFNQGHNHFESARTKSKAASVLNPGARPQAMMILLILRVLAEGILQSTGTGAKLLG